MRLRIAVGLGVGVALSVGAAWWGWTQSDTPVVVEAPDEDQQGDPSRLDDAPTALVPSDRLQSAAVTRDVEASPFDADLDVERWPSDARVSGVVVLPDRLPSDEVVDVVLRATTGLGWDVEEVVSRTQPSKDGAFQLRLPAGTTFAQVDVDARYVRADECIDLWPADSLEGLRLETTLGGRLRFQLIPPVVGSPEARNLIGQTLSLTYESIGPGAWIGAPPNIPGRIADDLSIEFDALSTLDEYWLNGQLATFVRLDREGPVVRLERGKTVDVDVPLQRGLTFAGRVLDEAGQPIGGAGLWFSTLDGRGSRSGGQTKRNGRFHIIGVSPTTPSLHVKQRGYLPQKHDLASLRGEGPLDQLEFVLLQGSAIRGVVSLPDGRPIEKARVIARSTSSRDANRATAVTDAQGRFELSGLKNGPRDLEVLASFEGDPRSTPSQSVEAVRDDSLPLWRGVAQAVAAGSTNVRVSLIAPVTLVGHVRDDTGAALTSFTVRAARNTEPGSAFEPGALWDEPMQTPDGSFRVSLQPGEWLVTVCSDGHTSSRTRRITLADRNSEEFVLERMSFARARVLGPDGNPVQQAFIKAMEWEHWDREDIGRGGPSNAQGECDVENIPRGPVTLIASANGFAHSEPVTVEGVMGWELPLVEFRLRPGSGITGELLDRAGAPASFRNVQLAPAYRSVAADDMGLFEFTNLPPGKYSVSSHLDGVQTHLGSVTLGESEHKHLVLRRAPVTVRVTGVVSSDGAAVENAQVQGLSPEGFEPIDRTTSDDAGRFELALSQDGRTELQVLAEGASHWVSYWVNLPPSIADNVVLELPAGGLRGHVLSDAPLPRWAHLTLHPPDASTETVWLPPTLITTSIGDGGSFEFTHIPPGNYSLRLALYDLEDRGDGASWPSLATLAGVAVAAGEVTDGVTFVVPVAGALRGTVVNPDGEAVAGTRVFVRDAHGRPLLPYGHLVHESGRYALAALPPGVITLEARAPGFSTTAAVEVELESGMTVTQDLRLTPSCTLHIVLETNVPPDLLQWSLRDASGADHARIRAVVDERNEREAPDGSLTRVAGPLPPGTYALLVTSPTGTRAERTLHLSGGGTETIHLHLE